MGERAADLSPSLGWPGGPCQVVERIEDEVRSPRLKHDLAEKVEHGRKLTNPEARKVYDLEREKGGGIFKQMQITPHAQYRMDQRGITVGDLRVALRNFSKKLNDWKSQKSWQWNDFQRATNYGEPVEWVDKTIGDLQVVFVNDRGVARIVSTFWKGMKDPRPEMCGLHPRHAGIQPEKEFGVQTWTKTPSPTKSDTGDTSGTGKYPTRGLPSPPWSRKKPVEGPVTFNVPGESGSDSGGSIHKDKARTKGVPGGQYDGGKTHPTTPARTEGPVRRPGMTAEGEFDEFDDEWLFREAISYKPRYRSPHPSGQQREREQKAQVARYDRKWYRTHRGPKLRKVKLRQRQLRNHGMWNQRKEWREELPQRHKRRPGGGARNIAERSKRQREKAKKRAYATVEIPFLHFPTEEWGEIIEVSPLGTVHIEWDDGDRDTASLGTFLDEAVVEDPDELFAYLDQVFEFEGGEDDPIVEDDDLFDTWLTRLAYAGFRLKRRPTKRRRKQRGIDKIRAKMRYKRNRMKSRQQSRKRYKRLKRNPQFKKQQQIRRKHPERFKMRLGEVLTAPDIAFVLEIGLGGDFVRTDAPEDGNLVLGYVRNISGMTGLVHFYLVEPGSRMLRSMPVREFLVVAGFLSEEDEDAMFGLIDAEVGIEAYGDPEEIGDSLVNLYTIESEFMHPTDKRWGDEPLDDQLIDPEDDDFYYGAVNKLASEVLATFFREQRPPDMDPDTKYDRGTPKSKGKRDRKKKPGDPGLLGPHEDQVKGEPGSRVLPGEEAGHIQRQAALIRDIREGCGPDLVARSRGIKLRLARVDSKNAVWLFDVQGSKGAHRVRLKALRKGNVRDMRKAHVKVSCSCPFWQWQGPEFHAKQGDYLYGRARGLATKPKVKDPSGQHRACKHVLAVFDHVVSKRWDIPKFRKRMGSEGRDGPDLHYLADTLRLGEMIAEHPEFEQSSRRVAARYLAAQEVLRDA